MRRDNYRQTWRTNEAIRAPELRVIGPDGKQIGILNRAGALDRAREAELDLVEIAPNAKPPVAKIIDFTKFRYDQDKKTKEERKKAKSGTAIKEIWFTPLIGRGDYEVRLGRVKEFLEEHEKVRIIVRPKRRLPKNDPLYMVLKRVLEDIKDIARVEQEPKMLGRQLVTLVAPSGSASSRQGGGGAKNQHEDKNEEQENSNPQVQSDSGREDPTQA